MCSDTCKNSYILLKSESIGRYCSSTCPKPFGQECGDLDVGLLGAFNLKQKGIFKIVVQNPFTYLYLYL